MRKLSHSRARSPRATSPVTLAALIARGARRLERAGVFFGHGTDNAWDESAALTLHALGVPFGAPSKAYPRRVGLKGQAAARALIERRVHERIPAPYLIGLTGFAGLIFEVDPRVLIPRSPLAELIERRFVPWIDPARVRRVLDLGTGSGCIAIACARAFARARVDATDVEAGALAVARLNVRRHRLGRRVRVVKSDHFRALGRAAYDIIVSNPPYVGARELAALPPEYRHEPRLALAAGTDGLASVRTILREARRHLRPRGILVVEVGNTESSVQRAFPRLPFTWLTFERGGGGVFVLTAEQLAGAARRR
ncbi:MAG TPA: 50S ribosomal protein L3 N(5)-glutamine methyltransferase [Steroidobacteraceae bacterium]|nr:50S ribosomal protein L3 N(5)-glutamine methyltransferase [Steroidobacteraceae bacterium]